MFYSKKKITLFNIAFFYLILCCVQSLASETKKDNSFISLQQRLIKDGFNKKRIEYLYKRPEVNIETSVSFGLFKIIKALVHHAESQKHG